MKSTPPIPFAGRVLEGYPVGQVFTFGPIEATEEEIIAFAKRYDPQHMHTDPVEAAASPFKGLMASGWHTASLMMRLLVDNYLSPTAGLPSPGIKELKWTLPVRPGDQLMARVTVLDARPSRSKPDRGIITTHIEGLNQNSEVVIDFTAANLVFRRGHLPNAG
ncbi:MAG TPA: MaoC family dehydratase [Nevskiaceae bacterium]|nr:MaoC family dehydratase [Nevskiaceae bacterium]